MKNFALVGAAGYIAPRHMKAIKETGNNLVAAFDPYDGIGILDSYFPRADFFVEFERFDRHLEKLKYEQNLRLHYLSICTPNYLHDAHVRIALRRGVDAICEKPLVLNPWNIDALSHIQNETKQKIFNILQLRLHPRVIELREKILKDDSKKIYDIDLTYLTSRGNWYYTSWKGDESKSGGIATNIGVHFFDMLGWIFGDLENCKVHINSHDRAAGFLQYKRANVRWFLSINEDVLPKDIIKSGQRTYRSLQIDGEEFEFSQGFTDLHTASYEHILNGKGYGLEDVRGAIELVYKIRNSNPVTTANDYHPMVKLPHAIHPFKKKS